MVGVQSLVSPGPSLPSSLDLEPLYQVTSRLLTISSPVTFRVRGASQTLVVSKYPSSLLCLRRCHPQARGPLPWFRALFEPHLASVSLTRVMWGGLQPGPISHFLGFFVSPECTHQIKMSMVKFKWKFQRPFSFLKVLRISDSAHPYPP